MTTREPSLYVPVATFTVPPLDASRMPSWIFAPTFTVTVGAVMPLDPITLAPLLSVKLLTVAPLPNPVRISDFAMVTSSLYAPWSTKIVSPGFANVTAACTGVEDSVQFNSPAQPPVAMKLKVIPPRMMYGSGTINAALVVLVAGAALVVVAGAGFVVVFVAGAGFVDALGSAGGWVAAVGVASGAGPSAKAIEVAAILKTMTASKTKETFAS